METQTNLTSKYGNKVRTIVIRQVETTTTRMYDTYVLAAICLSGK